MDSLCSTPQSSNIAMICKESETQEFLLDNALDDYDQLIWVNERETDQKLYRALPP